MKEYRQNSHTTSLVFWAVLCTATAIVLFIHSHKVVSRALKIEEILGGVALLIFGPAALAVYLYRARHVWVSVDHLRGIVVSGRRVIPWDEIRVVERRRPSFRKSTGPTEVSPLHEDATQLATNLGCEGCLYGFAEAFVVGLLILAAFFAIWLLFFVIVPLIVIPVLEVFAPFGDRFKIVTRRGTLVLRDLREADEFQQQVEQRMRVVVS
jgi:hypothetical protein